MAPNPLLDLSAGLSTVSVPNHPSGPPAHGPTTQAERAFSAASTFFSGVMAISATQFLGAPLKMIDPKFYEAYMAFTKQSFGVLITTMTQWWSPTVVKVSGDTSIPKQLFKREDGSLQCKFPNRLVMMANHQLYTDWLYLWWVAYTNNMHGYIYIILKESLKKIPIFGWGAQFYNFIFLARNWETDKPRFQKHLEELSNPNDPMWLLIFPEGTNLAKGTREKSKAWAEKQGLQDMKHQLLPRSRGLQFCLQNLKKSTEWLYDCTIGYEGIPPGQFGQDIFTLRSSMFEGRPPKSVNMHFRRFKIADIPVDNDKAFDVWLRNRWREKDYLLEHFVRYNSFPQDPNWLINQMRAQPKGSKKEIKAVPAKTIETQIKSNSLEEFLSIFAPLTSVIMVLFLFYGGGNPNDMLKMIGEATQKHQQLALVRDDTNPDNPLKLEKRQADVASVMPGKEAIKAAGDTAAQAQRNLMQKYVQAVRPQVKRQISLPDNSLRAKNVGEEPFKNKLKPKKAASVAGAPAKKPTPASRRPSLVTAPSSASVATVKTGTAAPSLSTAPVSATGTIVPSRETKLGLTGTKLAAQPGQPASKTPASGVWKGHTPIGTKKAVPKPKLPQANGELPTFKMGRETYEKMRAQNEAQNAASKSAPASKGIVTAAKKTPAQANTAAKRIPEVQKQAKKSPVGVNIDPDVLARMKAAKKT